jgi:hypothetical protein
MKKIVAMVLAFCVILMTSAVYGRQIQQLNPTEEQPTKVVKTKPGTPKKRVKKGVKHHTAKKPVKKGVKHHTVKKPVKK